MNFNISYLNFMNYRLLPIAYWPIIKECFLVNVRLQSRSARDATERRLARHRRPQVATGRVRVCGLLYAIFVPIQRSQIIRQVLFAGPC